MKPTDIRKKSAVELQKLLNESREELFHLKLKKRTGQLEKVHRVNELKTQIARILTILKENELNQAS